MKEVVKRLFGIFLVSHFLISMVIAICGLIMGRDQVLGYEDMFDPAIMALLCTIPTLLTIRSEKLSMFQLVLRKILQILIVEGVIFSMVYFGAYKIRSAGELITVATAVLFVFIGVSVFDWVSGYIEAEELNRRLAQMKNGRK